MLVVKEESPAELAYSKYLSKVNVDSSWESDDILKLARLTRPRICESGFSRVTDAFIETLENVKAVICTPLRLHGRFYGLLLICYAEEVIDEISHDIEFFLHTLSLAVSRKMREGRHQGPYVRLQSEARLSDRQIDIAKQVIRGMSNADIATSLHLSIGTVKVELGKIFKRLGITNRKDMYLPRDVQA